MQHEKETASAISFSWRRRRDSPGGTGAVPPPARGTKNPSTGGIFACLRAGRSLRVPFPNHHFNKNIPPFGRIFLLERVMGLSAHFAAWLGSALPARALHSLPGAGKGVTGAFPYPPFESPQFQFQQKYPPIREDISVGAGNGTRTHYLSLEG